MHIYNFDLPLIICSFSFVASYLLGIPCIFAGKLAAQMTGNHFVAFSGDPPNSEINKIRVFINLPVSKLEKEEQ
jgi:hypothetical protein